MNVYCKRLLGVLLVRNDRRLIEVLCTLELLYCIWFIYSPLLFDSISIRIEPANTRCSAQTRWWIFLTCLQLPPAGLVSTHAVPATMTPSTGIISPLCTIILSPTCRVAMDTSISEPARQTRTHCGRGLPVSRLLVCSQHHHSLRPLPQSQIPSKPTPQANTNELAIYSPRFCRSFLSTICTWFSNPNAHTA